MFSKKTKLRFRRVLRKRRKQVGGISNVADESLEKHFFKRLGRLGDVRRFVIGWIALVVLLMIASLLQFDHLRDKYQSLQPVAGGIFTEGIVGKYTNANPLYATSAVDSAVSKLIFAGLFQYDDQGNLEPNLAEKIEIDPTEKIYTVTLKPNLSWHDGQKLTSSDVAFTFNTAQNPDARSFLQASWKGVVVEEKDERTVVFKLPDRLSGFPHSLTTGLIPKHSLEKVNPEQLRSNNFNTISPIGAGPFKFDSIELENSTDENDQQQEAVGLVAFDNYAGGQPKINQFIIKTLPGQNELEQAFSAKEISSMAGLSVLPDQYKNDTTLQEISLPVAGQVMVFFKTSEKPLDSPEVRRALTLAADRKDIISSIGYPLLPSDSPLISSHVGYDPTTIQKTADQKQAEQILNSLGWKVDPADGIRKRGNVPLSFKIYSEANSEYASVTQSLQRQWREVGADVQVSLQSSQDLQSTISSHNYGALLYAISTGADPDVYAYWHSSQADVRSNPRLNFSEYESSIVDIALEGGRSRSDPEVRKAKYEPFIKAWVKDNPAIALYQPRYLYVVRDPFYGFDMKSLVSPADRYSNVEDWMIREARK